MDTIIFFIFVGKVLSIFTFIGILTLLSTFYDLHSIFVLKKDNREVSKLLRCFSVYTNTTRLLTFTEPPGSISCLDGIRSISILWVIIGHSFVNNFAGTVINSLDIVAWASSSKSLWLLSANLAVDTFFMMSGLLTVYTTASKTSQMSLLKNIHFFYLHRLLRMFPLLAAAVLLQATLFHHLSDGPNWHNFVTGVQNCRDWWWSALLHVQNYVNMGDICLAQTWYLSVDVQLHLVSPLLLFFALGGRRVAYGGLTVGLLLSLTIATTYCFVNNYDGVSFMGMIENDMLRNFKEYYVNTLTRSPAFVVGMIFGYFLHIWKNGRLRFSTRSILVVWILAIFVGSSMIYLNDSGVVLKRFWINLLSAIMRPLWAFALGMMILACVQGYGGPINWFLSLTVWKFIARVSYSMYLFHYPVQIMLRAASVIPIYFSAGNLLQAFVVDLVYTLTLATVMCVLIDAPYSTLIKMVFERSINSTRNPTKANGSSEILTQL